MFDLQHIPNKIVILSFDDSNKTEGSCFLFRRNVQNSFTANAENVHHLLTNKHPPFCVDMYVKVYTGFFLKDQLVEKTTQGAWISHMPLLFLTLESGFKCMEING